MINTYNESDLHKELKRIFCPKNGKTEVPLLGSICDILCSNKKIIEIQTSNLGALRLKLEKFLPNYKLEIVYPIAVDSLIHVIDKKGLTKYRRKSPKHGSFFQIFRELTSISHLINNKNLHIKIVYIINEIIKTENSGSKPKLKIINKKLIEIKNIEKYKSIKEICIPVLRKLPKEFTNYDIKNLNAGKHTGYTSRFLKKAGLIEVIGKKERFILYKKI